MAGAGEPFLPRGCLAGCLGAVLLVASFQLFGWRTTGAACVLFAWASMFFTTIMTGRFEWRPGRRAVRSAERPVLYGSICLVLAFGTVVAEGAVLREIAAGGTAF